MTIKYKAIKTAQPGVKGGGTYKYYPRICKRRMVDIKSLAEQMARKSTLSRADIHATLIALADEIPQLLLDNCSVQLGEVGIFSPVINGVPADSEKELTYRNIKNVKMVFRPGKMVKDKLKFARFKRIKD